MVLVLVLLIQERERGEKIDQTLKHTSNQQLISVRTAFLYNFPRTDHAEKARFLVQLVVDGLLDLREPSLVRLQRLRVVGFGGENAVHLCCLCCVVLCCCFSLRRELFLVDLSLEKAFY